MALGRGFEKACTVFATSIMLAIVHLTDNLQFICEVCSGPTNVYDDSGVTHEMVVVTEAAVYCPTRSI